MMKRANGSAKSGHVIRIFVRVGERFEKASFGKHMIMYLGSDGVKSMIRRVLLRSAGFRGPGRSQTLRKAARIRDMFSQLISVPGQVVRRLQIDMSLGCILHYWSTVATLLRALMGAKVIISLLGSKVLTLKRKYKLHSGLTLQRKGSPPN